MGIETELRRTAFFEELLQPHGVCVVLLASVNKVAV